MWPRSLARAEMGDWRWKMLASSPNPWAGMASKSGERESWALRDLVKGVAVMVLVVVAWVLLAVTAVAPAAATGAKEEGTRVAMLWGGGEGRGEWDDQQEWEMSMPPPMSRWGGGANP